MDYRNGNGVADEDHVAQQEVKLEKVLGLTVSNNAAFDCDPHSGIVAYPAGCVVVLYYTRKNKQEYILSSSKKTITSLAFSSDGRYLATGECGHQPHVRVWDVQEKVQVAEFQGHKYGINCVAFSPNLKYVVSVGSQHDMIVNVWDWKNNVKVASNKVSCKVKALSFASNGNYFVTVGNRHVKFWYLEYSRSTKYKLEPVPLMGRSAILGDQRNNYFCDVACGKGDMVDSTFAITKSGLLCEFNSRRLLDKWVELRTTSANSISLGEKLIIIGCSEGIIRCFSPFDLHFISTLPRPHHLGVDIAKTVVGNKSYHPSNIKYPDIIAIALDEFNKKVTCVYNDHSLYVWDIKDTKKVGKSHSFMYHSACIWGIEIYPDLTDGSKNILPKNTFLTCSSDDTIRFWNLEPTIEQDTAYHKNIYSSELLKILYVDPELSYICDTDLNAGGSSDKVDTTYDGKNGVRCLRISPEGRHLASGDRSGNIRIHDLEFIEELCKVEAHDSEVLCLEYSKPVTVSGQEKKYLSSASRDRLIHVFDVKQDYAFQQTLDDHSSSITAVRFVQNDGFLQMISCGADKSIIFRKATFNPQLSLVREHHVVGKTTLYDMEVDVPQRHILTACQDRNIRVYSVTNGKHSRCFRGSQGEDGTLIKVVLDPSGTFLATSCTDKSLYLYDYITGECLATMFGHSELVTGLKFTNNGQNLISVSGDGCIFVWRLPTEVTQTMLSKQIPVEGNGLPSLWQEGRRGIVAITKPLQLQGNNDPKVPDATDLVNNAQVANNATPPGYRFSFGKLPLWAKKTMLDKVPDPSNVNQNLTPPVPPRGRWAQKIDGQELIVRSYMNSDSVIPSPNVSETSEVTIVRQENETNVHAEFNSTSVHRVDSKDVHFEVCEQSLKEILTGTFTGDTNGNITLRHTVDSLSSTSKRENRSKHLSNSSNIRLEEIDAEDERSDSEVSEMVYYPASEDGSDIADGTYHVCANNENNPNSANNSKKSRSEKVLNDIPVMSTPEQNETNSDDEDVRSPVDSDRSFLGSLCISTENLERLGQREKFMKSNYESLERGDNLEIRNNDVEDRNFYRQSISAKFLAGTPRVLVNGTSKAPPVPERQLSTPTKKREELLKALSEAKKKLETVGYNRGLSSSKSIADLHSTPDREIFKRPKSGIKDSDIRRVSSMTDLSISNSPRGRLFSTPEKSKESIASDLSAPLWNQSQIYPVDTSPPASPKLTPSPPCQNAQDRISQNSIEVSSEVNMSRSISTNSLVNKKDMPSPKHKTPTVYTLDRTLTNSPGFGGKSPLSVLGRPSLPSLPSRYQSAKDISSATTLATDSSSDSSPTESAPEKGVRPATTPKPIARTRYFSSESSQDNRLSMTQESNEGLQKFKLKSRSEWDLKNSYPSEDSKDGWQSGRYLSYSPRKNYGRLQKLNSVGAIVSSSNNLQRSQSGKDISSSESSSLSSLDPASMPLSTELCENVAENLCRVTSVAMQIFQRLSQTNDLPPEEKSAMTNILAQSVWQAQQTLRPAVPSMSLWPNDYQASGFRRLPGLMSQSNGDLSGIPLHGYPPNTTALLQQYSDKLLSILQQKMTHNSQEKPNS